MKTTKPEVANRVKKRRELPHEANERKRIAERSKANDETDKKMMNKYENKVS